jgi:hypothetical protein
VTPPPTPVSSITIRMCDAGCVCASMPGDLKDVADGAHRVLPDAAADDAHTVAVPDADHRGVGAEPGDVDADDDR